MNRRDLLRLAAGGALCGSHVCRSRAARAETAAFLRFTELYEPGGSGGLVPSSKTTGLAGRAVVMKGFMAPPLKADADFFVLTREPMAVCPFCDNAADWPADIVVVRLAGTLEEAGNAIPIAVTGRLDVGAKVDPATGFVSLIRLVDAVYRPL